MGSLSAYSGLATKVHAMKSKLITTSQYVEISELGSVADLFNYLQQFPAYSILFEKLDPNNVHRGNIETMLNYSLYRDFTKIYNFAGIKQRRYLKLYFMKYEVAAIKKYLRGVLDERPDSNVLVMDNDFELHTDINTKKVAESQNIDEFIENLKGTVYYEPLLKMRSVGNASQFDYGLCLDLFRFCYIWKQRKKYFKGDELYAVTHSYGTKIDLLNVMWAYRCKQFYNVPNNDIYSYLIPIYYKLKPAQLREMIDSDTIDGFMSAFSKTFYGEKFSPEDFGSLREMYNFIIAEVYRKDYKHDPYSLACINEYLFLKEQETRKIITAAESIRYGYSSDRILENIAKTGGDRQ
ncbi:MAG: V0D/AC39 family V-type ATPase subunit [Eubacterium sp.]